MQIGGVVKWFDVAQGYGFIIPDNGMRDVLLHVACLRRSGYQTTFHGARIVCEALQDPTGGFVASRIMSIDEFPRDRPALLSPSRVYVNVAPTSDLERVRVKWFNRLRGFGFLTRGEGTPDIFIHMETLRRYCMTELWLGQFVLVRYGPGPKGLMATEVRPARGPLN